ncbi:MAG: Rrf2 family transcriptional regulator [Saprospiraceae bacterium]|nr:Rrf2 family transcriptional regulator [Saprospiraceae bacterium]
MLSLGCKASIKAMVFLASRPSPAIRSGIRDVASHIGENEHTVGKLLQKLVRHGLVNSSKGPNGGFFLTAPQRNLSLMRIIEVIDGDNVFHRCGLGLNECSETHPCPLHNDFKVIRTMFEKLCNEKRIVDLTRDLGSGMAHLLGTNQIIQRYPGSGDH